MIDLSLFWLTDNQSKLYQIWLQYGSRSVSFLASKVWFHRVLAYNTLQELVRVGYCTCITKWNTGYYSMVDPHFIKEKIQQKLVSFDSILPQLQALHSESKWSFKVKLFQGREWIKALYDEVTYSQTNLKAFLWADHIDPEVERYLYDVYLPKRVNAGIHSSAIVSDTDANRYFADSRNVPQTETLIIPVKTFDMDCEVILFDHTKILIATLSTDEMSWLLIESKNLHKSLDNIFDLLWSVYATTHKKA